MSVCCIRHVPFVCAMLALGARGADLSAAEPLPYLHPMFGDHAVFPRDRAAPVWGWTTPGAKLHLTLGSTQADAVAGADGRWQAALGPLAAGGPYELTIDGPQKVVCHDVLIGDVWLFSGQSNMEMGVGGAEGAAEEGATAGAVTNLRIMHVGHRLSATPRVVPTPGKAPLWQVPANNAISGFSAVAWYTGKRLASELKIPIGVVSCAWGGSNIRGWMAEGTLNQLGLYADERTDLAKFAAIESAGGADVPTQEQNLINAWWQNQDAGTSGGFAQPAVPSAGAWTAITVPATDKVPDGVVWLRREVDVPAAAAGTAGRLRLGAMLEEETTWINGTEVGHTGGWNGMRVHQVPAKLLVAGRNVIAIRTLATGGRGGPHGQPADWQLEINGQPTLPLDGAWQYAATVAASVVASKPVPRFQGGNRSPTMLYQGGIQPLAPFGFSGVVWYQGEQDSGNPDYYRLLPALIADWRTLFAAPKLPFVVVQLPGFGQPVKDPVQSQLWFGLVRDAQRQAATTVPQVGLAVTADIGDPNNVHPPRKREVGERAANAALGVAYGRDAAGGALYAGMQVEGAAIRVSFTRVHGDFELRPAAGSGFAIAGADGMWHHATAKVDGQTVLVSAPEVVAPTAVRYDWADYPAVTLYDQAGMPASLFRSDAGR